MSEPMNDGMREDPGLLLFDHGIPDAYLNCQTSSYSRMLRSLRLDPRVLGDQWWYSYQPGFSSDWPVGTFSFLRREYRETIFDWYEANERIITHASPQQAFERVRSAVAAGRDITLCLDVYHYQKASFFYRNSHHPRRVVINDYRDGELHVLDGLGEGRFTGWMQESEVVPAADSRELEIGNWGFNARNTTIEITESARTMGELRPDQVRERLLEVSTLLLTPRNDRLSTIGLQALRAFADDLPRCTAELAASPGDMGLHISNTLGGIASQRQLNVMFLELASSMFPNLDNAASHFRKAAREWYKAFTVFLFGMRLRRDPVAIATELANRIDVLIEVERVGAEAILSTLDI